MVLSPITAGQLDPRSAAFAGVPILNKK